MTRYTTLWLVFVTILQHLDFANNQFHETKMYPSLKRALRHKEILGV